MLNGWVHQKTGNHFLRTSSIIRYAILVIDSSRKRQCPNFITDKEQHMNIFAFIWYCLEHYSFCKNVQTIPQSI